MKNGSFSSKLAIIQDQIWNDHIRILDNQPILKIYNVEKRIH